MMVQTEIGLLPEDWEVVRLENVGSFTKGCGISRNDSQTGKIPAVRYGELYTDHNNYIKQFKSFISSEVAKTARKMKTGCILFTASGETKEDIGKAVAFLDDIEAYAGGDLIILNPKADYCSLYLGYTLNSLISVRQRAMVAQGDSVVHITTGAIRDTAIPVPYNLAEQQNIASALSSIDKLIDDLGRTIQKKQLIREGAMEGLLSGKKRLPGFTEDWVEKNLGEVCQIIMGQSPDSRYYNTSKQGFPLIQGNADIENRKSIDRIYTTQITKICDVGDVIMSVRAPVGAVGISSKKSCIGRGICAMKGCNSFVYQWLIFQESKWAFLSTGSTFDSINSDALNKVRLLTPIDENEQHAIANILTSMDDEISVLQIEKAKYEQIRSGMMEELLTGAKRLK